MKKQNNKFIRWHSMPAPLKKLLRFNSKPSFRLSRRITPFTVLTSSTRIRSSRPEIALMFPLMRNSVDVSSHEPITIFDTEAVHLFLTCSSLIQSWDHFFQNCCLFAVIWAQVLDCSYCLMWLHVQVESVRHWQWLCGLVWGVQNRWGQMTSGNLALSSKWIQFRLVLWQVIQR